MPRKRKSGDGGLYYDTKRDLWIGVVDVGFNAEGGRKQKRVSSRSQSVARTKLRAVQAEIESSGSPLGNKTVDAWAEYWLAHMIKPVRAASTYRAYRSVLDTWILPVIGRKNMKDVRPSDLRAIYDAMKVAGKLGSTQVKAHTVLSSMYEAARLERIVPSNVARDIRPPKAGKPTRGALQPAETLSVLEASRGHRDGTKWQVSLYGAIRQGERCGATLDSVDLSRREFTVRWNLVEGNYDHGCGGTCGKRAAGWCPQKRLVIPDDGHEYRVLKGRLMLGPPKSKETRTFPIPEALADELERHMADLSLQPNPYGLLWPNADGSIIDARQDQEEWKALLIEAGVDNPDATTHWARHTAITDLSASGATDRTIGEMVGHKSPNVTGGYTHPSSQDQIEAMKRLGERRTND